MLKDDCLRCSVMLITTAFFDGLARCVCAHFYSSDLDVQLYASRIKLRHVPTRIKNCWFEVLHAEVMARCCYCGGKCLLHGIQELEHAFHLPTRQMGSCLIVRAVVGMERIRRWGKWGDQNMRMLYHNLQILTAISLRYVDERINSEMLRRPSSCHFYELGQDGIKGLLLLYRTRPFAYQMS